MKKIYILTAVFALLTLSLNAQTMASKKVANNTTTSTEKKAGMPIGGAMKAHDFGINRAPSRAVETTTVTFTAGTDAASAKTLTKDGVTITNTQTSTNNNSFNYNPYRFYPSTLTFSTESGNITNITIAGSSTTYPVSRISGTGYSYSGNNGTWNGTASSVSLTVASQTRVNSIVVTVETETGGGETSDLTVCNGQYFAQYLPVFGYYHDEAQHNQMIYPASMLREMVGKTIKSMTFYPTAGSVTWSNGTTESASGINFRNGSVCFKLANISSGNSFDANNPSFVNATLTEVSTINMPSTANTSATTWLITFSNDFVYTGGDLLIDVTNPTTGNWGLTFFTVDETNNYYGYTTSGAGNGALNYLPKVTFTYEGEPNPIHDLAIALDAQPASVGPGGTVTLTATVTNNGNQPENGYTVTFTADGTTINTQTATTELAAGESTTFTYTYTTTNGQSGTTVNFGANVACTDDANASNNTATASTSVLACPPPENVQATAGNNQNATMTWEAPIIPSNLTTVNESFEDGTTGWTFIDSDGDGYNWYRHTNTGSGNYTVHTGSSVMASESFNNDSGTALTPDNWLISPEVTLDGILTLWAAHQSTYPENFAVYICIGSYNSVNDFVKISNDITTNATMTEYPFDLSQYNGQTGHIAIRHYNSRDNFILLIDDITYQTMVSGEQPVSYNIYLDGVLVDNVSSSTFSYDFSNVAGEHTCAVSAVYSYGESEAVPVTFTTTPKTATPTLSMVDNGDGTYTITATAASPDTDAQVTLNVTGQQPVTGTGSASITITQTDADQPVTATATAQATDKLVSNEASENFIVPALPITPTPAITYVVNGDNVVITATGQGEVTLNVTGQEPVTGNGTVSITLPRTDANYTVTATATAQAAYHQQSAQASEEITIPFLQTEAPSITYSSDGESVTITATANEPDANAVVTLTVGNGEPVTGTGSVSVTVPCGVTSTTVTATATAKVDGKAQSETTTEQVPIPGGEGWLEMYGTYNNPGDLLSLQSLEVDEDGEHLEIMMIDQFLASTFDNEHPNGYTYIMKETVNNEEKSSNSVNIPVYKTNSSIQGLYTKKQVDDDIDMHLTANAINSEMDYNVHPDRNTLYYSLYRGDMNANYPVIDVPHRISQLQKFDELVDGNVQYFMFENHTDGISPRYNHLGTQIAERLDTNYVQGSYNDELSYVPVIWTYGLYTARGDGKNNSYGSDIKREKLGDVTVKITGSKSGANNVEDTGAGWEGLFKVGNEWYCIYTPIIDITGVVPCDGENVQNDRDVNSYVPYMYRAWCLYPGARNFKHVAQTNSQGQTVQVLADDGELTIPYLLGTNQVEASHTQIGQAWQNGQPKLQWAFGVPVSEDPANVLIAVRFYYKKNVNEIAQPNSLRGGNRDGEVDENSEEYYIVQVEGTAEDIETSINEFYAGKAIVGVTYVNSLGMKSDKPFDGLNIVVTRYSDGTTSTTKVMR